MLCPRSTGFLMGSRKPSSSTTYLAKWKQFACWALDQNLLLKKASFQSILDYLLHLKLQGLSLSSVKVHMALFQPSTLQFRAGQPLLMI